MEQVNFWLISIEESALLVSLVSKKENGFQITSVSPKIAWVPNSEESFVSAIDESISCVSNDLGLSENDEPDLTAFILPPFWVGSDGKIISSKLKLIESACKNLTLKPMGFIANDEAITEDSNSADGFPSSFILINLGENFFTLSLVYLGKVKERIHKVFSEKFSPSLIETALLEIDSQSALPPEIILFGSEDQSIVSDIKNFPWVGKKNIEVFLHFPDVKFYDIDDIVNIYARVIVSQMGGFLHQSNNNEKVEEISDNDNFDEDEKEIESLEEVDASDFGFYEEVAEKKITEEKDIEESVNETVVAPEVMKSPKKINFGFKIRLPKIKFPQLKFKKPSWIFAFTPLVLLIPLFFSKADITVFVTPFNFSKQVPVTFDSSISDLSGGNIPVGKKTFDISASASVKTTGEKTVGEKAKGEIVIFNKLEKTQNLLKGAVLGDFTGKKFELVNSVSIASSSSDLNAGIISLGQTKGFVSALDIGQEYNLGKDTKLNFNDLSENVVIAKVKENFSGGSKRQVSVVGTEDKKNLEQKINEAVKESGDKKIKEDLSSLEGAIKETIQSKKDRIEFNREVGEEADDLNASVKAKVTVFFLNREQKSKIINEFLANENGFGEAVIDPDLFDLSFSVNSMDEDKAVGTLAINGKALPKINVSQIKKDISGKYKNKAVQIIKKKVARVYNFKINNNLRFLDLINPLPLLKDHINIDIKTE